MYEIVLNHATQGNVLIAVNIYSFKLYSEDIFSSDEYSSLSGVFIKRINIGRHSNNGTQIKDITKSKLNKKLPLSLPYGSYIIPYKNNKIEFEFSYNGEPMATEGIIIVDETITLRSNESMDIILDFVREALKHYKNNILEHKPQEAKITSWLYDDGYWERLNSHTPRNMNTIYIEKSKKTALIHDIKLFQKKETLKRYSELGLRYKRNYLFAGYPGTGKSSLAFALASTLNMGIAIINFGPKVTDAILAKALKDIPKDTILLLEDMDALFKDRKSTEYMNMITFSGLLNCLDGICTKEGLITIMTTNYKNKLDIALKRPGRIDYIMDFEYSSKLEIKMMYEKFFPKLKDNFEKFYKKVAHTNLTMATLQEYFLEHMDGNNLIEDINILKTRASELKYSDRPDGFYT